MTTTVQTIRHTLKTVSDTGKLNTKALCEKRKEEIRQYTSFYQELAKLLADRELAEEFSSYSGLRKLANGDIIVSLYGDLRSNPDPNVNKYGPGFNGDGSWGIGSGEELVVIVDKDSNVKYFHVTQERKLEDLWAGYDRKYENLDKEPENYHYIWCWPIEDYREIKFNPNDPQTSAFIPTTGAAPQTLKTRELTPQDIAKHDIFADEGLKRIQTIANSLFQSKSATASNYDTTIGKLRKIISALNAE